METKKLPHHWGSFDPGQVDRLFRASGQIQFFAKEGVDAQLGDID